MSVADAPLVPVAGYASVAEASSDRGSIASSALLSLSAACIDRAGLSRRRSLDALAYDIARSASLSTS